MLPNSAGGAIDDAYLYRIEETEYLLVVNAATTAIDFAWLQDHLKRFPGVAMEDQTGKLAMASLQGPRTKTLLEGILRKTNSKLPDPGRNNIRKASIAGIPVIVGRTGYSGEPIGFELFFGADRASEVWEEVLHRGEDQGIVPVGLGGRDTLRLEATLPLHGYELGLDLEGREIPILAFPHGRLAVSFSEVKGDYIGRKALWSQFQEVKSWEEGRLDLVPKKPLVPRRIWPVAILSEGVVRRNFEIYCGDSLVGRVTSGTMVPYWKFEGEGLYSAIGEEKGRRAIAMAYLNSDLKENQ